jgi:hypothetical protein
MQGQKDLHSNQENKMPHKFWKHTCTEKGEIGLGVEVCPDCGEHGTYDGWHFSVIEFMGAYVQRTGLKPYGAHRVLADKLIESRMKNCPQCDGRGMIDINHGESYKICSMCHGKLAIFDGSQEELESLQQEVLRAYPYAVPGTHNPDGEETSGFTGGIFIRPKDNSPESKNETANAIAEALGVRQGKKKPATKKKSPSKPKSKPSKKSS